MIRSFIVWSLSALALGGSLAFAQDMPPLEAPASEPDSAQATAPAAPRPKPAPPTPSPGSSRPGPTLVIPGVTVPSPRVGAAAQPSRPPLSVTPNAGSSPPSGAVSSTGTSPFAPGDDPRGQDAPPSSSVSPIPLTIEPLDDEPAPAQDRSETKPSRETPRRPPGSTASDEPAIPPARPRPAPWRMPGLLGRVMGQPPTRSSDEAARRSEGATRPKAKADPDDDAVVQRRIEKQIRGTLGDKVQSLQVRVTGRNVLIVARPTRFWQKRGVQRTLESLPVLAGFRVRIDLGN